MEQQHEGVPIDELNVHQGVLGFRPADKKDRDNSTSTVVKSFTSSHGHTIQVRQGDITQEEVGAIVNAANEDMVHGAGLAGIISRVGGSQVRSESERWVQRYGKVPVGGIALSGPGQLPCRCVIHAVGPVCKGREKEEVMKEKDLLLASAVRTCLNTAEALRLHSISIPALSAGVFGFPKDRCARVLFGVAREFGDKYPQSCLREIRFILNDQQSTDTFAREFEHIFS